MPFIAEKDGQLVFGDAPNKTLADLRGRFAKVIEYTPREDEVPVSVNFASGQIKWGPRPQASDEEIPRLLAESFTDMLHGLERGQLDGTTRQQKWQALVDRFRFHRAG